MLYSIQEIGDVFMDIQEVGRMLYMLRKEKAMSQEELCRGFCSVATLSRMEKGECRLDIYTFHAILERLGRSAKGIQSVLTLEEFAFLVKRRNIQIALMTKEYEQAQQDIFELEAEMEKKGNSLQKQEVYYLYGICCLQKDRNYALAAEYIQKALAETMYDFEIKKEDANYLTENLYLCNAELQLLLLYVYLRTCAGREETSLLENIFEYIRCRFLDESAKNQNLAKVNHLQAFVYKKNQCWEKCYECCEAAIEAEVKNSRLILLYQALEMEMECLQNGIKRENGWLRQKQYGYLKEVMEEYGQEGVIGECSYFTDDVLQGKSVIDEVIRYARMRGEYTQEEFSEGICTPETLSRIETARRNPTIKNFYALMQKSGIGMDFYNTEFEVKQFDTMEKIALLRKLTARGKQQEAEELLKEIELEIDISKNQQQLGIFHVVYDWRAGRITMEEALERSKQLADLTLKKTDGKYEIPYQLTAVEFNILNQVAVYYSGLGRSRQAIDEIFMPLYEHFEESKLDKTELGREYLMVMINLAMFYQEIGEWKKALDFTEKTIITIIRQNWIVWLGYNLFVKYKIQKALGFDIKVECFKKAYCINSLGGDVETAEGIKQYVWEQWQTDIEAY